MQRLALFTVASFLFFSIVVPIRGDLVVSIGDLSLPVGGTGYVDVMVSSNSPGGDLLNAFNIDFRISSQGQSRLEFLSNQPDPQLANVNYVFYGNSFDHDDPLNTNPFPVGTVSSLGEPNNRFVGGDNTADYTDVTVNANSKLLARLQVTANTDLPPNAGDTFTISFDASGTSFQHGDITSPTMVPYTVGSPGIITVVPEPNTLLSLIAGITPMFYFFGTRRAKWGRIGVQYIAGENI